MRKLFVLAGLFFSSQIEAQELYVYSEPASNMPARSVSLKLTSHLVPSDNIYNRVSHRFMPQVMFGFSKNFMLHVGGTIANMHTTDTKYESWNVYMKYRFLSKDEIHKHFRMAVFAEGSYTRAPFHYDEITLMGDKSGVQLGVIATQLWNKFALSGTVSHIQVLDKSRGSKIIYVPERAYQSIDFSLSGGYLLLPREYKDYKQLNVNLYAELLGQQNIDVKRYAIDLAPAVQLIFNSNAKLNIGYRVQLAGSMQRMTKNSWQISFERTFLNALKKK
jgi:hypothetical protein